MILSNQYEMIVFREQCIPLRSIDFKYHPFKSP